LKKKTTYILFLLVSVIASGQFRFSHLGISQGLSQNSVHCIFQDSEGYIWLGTQDGLNRYDAYSFRTFKHNKNDTTSISDNFITGITEDNLHNLWIGTRNGANRFDRKTEKFDRIFPDGMDKNYFHNAVKNIFKDSLGNIYFNSHRSFYCAKIGEAAYAITKFAGKNYPGERFCAEKNGNLLAADSLGLLEFTAENGSYSQAKRICLDTCFASFTNVALLYSGKKGMQWVAERNKIFIYDPFKRSGKRKNIPAANYHCISEDVKGNTWLGGDHGVLVLNKEGDVIANAVNKPGAITSLNSNNVLSLYCDKSDCMWVGTSEGGVNVYNPFQDVFMTCRKEQDEERSISDNVTWAVFQDDKKLFIGTSSGLNIFSLKENSFKNSTSFEDNVQSRIFIDQNKEGKNFGTVTSIIKVAPGSYWAGTKNEGIISIDSDGKINGNFNTQNSNLQTNTIFQLMKARDGSVWISTGAGLYHYNFQTKIFESFLQGKGNAVPSNYVISSYEDHNGKIWISTASGLSCYTPSTKQFLNYTSSYTDTNSLSYNIVTSCLETSAGQLWISTLGGGIDLFDPKTNSFKSYGQEEGLANNVVYGMNEDKNGDLWMSSNAGISCFHVKTVSFINYFPADGIISNEYAQNGCFKNQNGELFFASPEGVLLFNPANIHESKVDPPVILSSYAVNYQKKNAYPVSLAKSLDLAWNEKTVSFEFSALDYTAAEKINYSYKLEGFDNDWVIANPGQRIATYTSLPFGKYIFKVRISKNGSQWSQEYLDIAVNVIPPFWLSWWFILGEIIVGLALLILTIRYYAQRKLRIKLRGIEVQQKVQFERERISRDLHDNVGAHLTYIIQSLDNISFRIEKNPAEKPTEKIDSLGEFARGTMQQLRETIWAINKEEISVTALKDKIQEHLNRLSAAVGTINFSVVLGEETTAVLKPSQAIHIFRLVQEALNNAVKHSGAKSIRVQLVMEKNNLLLVSIHDDGKGFDPEETFEGHYGMENMRSRVKEMGGNLVIESELLKGTEIKLEVPV
jgi:signal transduction histidine kinase/ligand-binding sensor domain-containing protein